MDSISRKPEARRSTRVRAQISLRITSLDATTEFSEPCQTLVVNMQGCGIRLSRSLDPGTAVLLEELPNDQTATAQVAHSVPLGVGTKDWLVGVALNEPRNIWGINPAPLDWGAPAGAAKAAVPIPAKKDEWPYRQFSNRGEFHPGRK